MRFAERTIELKDGRKCILRAPRPEDAAAMIEFLRAVSEETPYLIRNADEVDFTEQAERELLGNKLDAEREFMMLVEIDGAVAGNCAVMSQGALRRLSHRCAFAIALRKAYWHLGLGSAMMEYALELAEQIGYEQTELDVVEGNDRAKALYEKFGFEVTGKNMRALKYDDGSYRDEYAMVKIFERTTD